MSQLSFFPEWGTWHGWRFCPECVAWERNAGGHHSPGCSLVAVLLMVRS